MDHLSIPGANQQQISQYQNQYQNSNDLKKNAYVKITEQPAQKSFRFRYESEGRFTGSIPGNKSNTKTKTYPSIQVVGYVGKAYVVVSCVTKDYPHRPHPHYIVGKTGCKGGVCRLDIPPDTMSVTFSNIGIRCVKRKEIEESLRLRKLAKVDPFQTGFDPNKPTPIDLNVVRLCFQVIVQTDNKNIPLTPVVSDCIYNKKGQSDLTIAKLSDCTSDVDGGKKDIILLCEKVDRDDIQIRFYEEKNNQIVWDYLCDVRPSQVHKQVAMIFRAPPYHTLDVTEPVHINIQLRRPSDGAASDPVPFQLLPLKTVEKRKKYSNLSPLLWNTSKPTVMGVGNIEQNMYNPATTHFGEPSGQSTFDNNIPDIFAPLPQTPKRKSSGGFDNEGTDMEQQFHFGLPLNSPEFKLPGFQNIVSQTNQNLININEETEETKPHNIIPLAQPCNAMNILVPEKLTASPPQFQQNWQPPISDANSFNNYAQNVLETNGLNNISHKWNIVSQPTQDNLNFELPKWNTGAITGSMNVLTGNIQMPAASQNQIANVISKNLGILHSTENTMNCGTAATNNSTNTNTTYLCNNFNVMETSACENLNNLSDSFTHMSLENMSCDSLSRFLNSIADGHLKPDVCA